MLGPLQRETELTRPTLAEILHKSNRLGEVTHNPQQFLEHAVAAIQKSLHDLMVQGIEYERIADAEWEMHRLEIEELESYVSRLLEVRNSIYDVVEFESKVEYEFAKALDARKDIKLFFKLPTGSKWRRRWAPTIPIGPLCGRNQTARIKSVWCVKPKAPPAG